MNKINIIDSSIYNRISAGEVIERPKSVVKECVENSLDGGAQHILVTVSNNAKNLRIQDDGCGMSREDAKIAFLPHTTSKISKVEDLEVIETLGFRGEALASIAAVSMVELNTYDKETEIATRVDIKGGVIERVTDSIISFGTDIKVENLFYNTPVREKFLKSPKSEESEIVDLMARFILSYPDVHFRLILNDEFKYKFDGGGLEKAVYCVYGKELLENSLYIEGERNGISVKGYVSNTSYTKPNRTYQTAVLNGRRVVNETISLAIQRAYQPYMMRRCFPFYALHITIDPEKVDVNVHPTKYDVRFSDKDSVFSALYHIVGDAINADTRKRHDEYFNKTFTPEEILKNTAANEPDCKGLNFDAKTPINYAVKDELKESAVDPKIYDETLYKKPKITGYYDETPPGDNSIGIYKRPKEKGANGVYLFDKNIVEDESILPDSVNVIGVFNSTYIMAECNGVLYIIDQHAAHERILYDKYTYSYYNQKIMIQDLLVPYVLNLNAPEDEFMRQNITNLFVLGFAIEPFGDRTYRITSVPAALLGINLDDFFADIFSDLNKLTTLKGVEIIREKLMQKACKNAVKAGQRLSDAEIKEIFIRLKKTKALTCPHGRPIVVTFTKSEIEKMFKRIV